MLRLFRTTRSTIIQHRMATRCFRPSTTIFRQAPSLAHHMDMGIPLLYQCTRTFMELLPTRASQVEVQSRVGCIPILMLMEHR